VQHNVACLRARNYPSGRRSGQLAASVSLHPLLLVVCGQCAVVEPFYIDSAWLKTVVSPFPAACRSQQRRQWSATFNASAFTSLDADVRDRPAVSLRSSEPVRQ
jgi:hypothetical protein